AVAGSFPAVPPESAHHYVGHCRMPRVLHELTWLTLSVLEKWALLLSVVSNRAVPAEIVHHYLGHSRVPGRFVRTIFENWQPGTGSWQLFTEQGIANPWSGGLLTYPYPPPAPERNAKPLGWRATYLPPTPSRFRSFSDD